MPRTVTANALAEMAKKTGTEPVNIIEIEWVNGTNTLYADKQLTGISGLIESLDNIDEIIALSDGQTTAQIGVTLIDTDGSIKTLMDQHDLHLRPVRVYQYFDGLDLADKFLIFEGKVVSPITWSEGQRIVTFQAISRTISKEVGFSPDEGQFGDVPYDLIGSVWPLCFGSPIHVPAVKATQYKVGSLMNIVGQPDPTLPLKLEYLEFRRDELIRAYNFYQQLITVCKGIARPAYQIQDDYAHHIVSHDQLKQTIEDNVLNIEAIAQQLDKAMNEWHNAQSNLAKSVVETHINSLKSSLARKRKLLKGLFRQKKNMEVRERGFQIELENVKYEMSIINRLRNQLKKIMKYYYTAVREISSVSLAIEAQSTLQAMSASVMDGYIFPQNQSRDYRINGAKVNGTFSGYAMTINAINPVYRNVPIATRQSEDLDTFWLQGDQQIGNMYILANDNRIIKITSQQGKLCKIDLPPKNTNKTTKAKEVDYINNADDKQAFDDAMGRLLAGNETAEQKAQIANNIPKHISPRIWKILTNDGRTQTVKLVSYNGGSLYSSDLDNSWFKLSYGDEEITDKIKFTDSAADVKTKIAAAMPSVKEDHITVEVTDTYNNDNYNVAFKITVTNDLMKPFKIYESGIVNATPFDPDKLIIETQEGECTQVKITIDRSELRSSTTRLTGTLEVVFAGRSGAFEVDTQTAGSMVTLWESANLIESGDITASGGPLFDSDLVFEYNVPYKSILINNISIVEKDSHNEESELSVEPYLQVINGTASEYTTRQRERKIDDAIEESMYSKAIIKYRDKVREALKKVNEFNPESKETLEELKKSLAQSLQQYATIVGKSDMEEMDLNDAYRVISDDEKKLLYELEVTGYVEWVNSIRNLDDELEEEISYEYTALDITEIKEVSPVILPSWLQPIRAMKKAEKMAAIANLPNNTQAWIAQVGDRVTLDSDYQEVFVANILPSTVHAVYAYNNSGGLKRLQPVPTDYYEKNESYSYGGYDCTTITLRQPLKTIDSSWDDQIYVTLTSSVGPNVCDIMQWIIEKYTNGSIDTTTFAHVKTLQTNYPCHFALFDKRDAFQLLQDIAHQARCYIFNKFNVFYLRYIPEIPEPVATLTDSNIEETSMELTFTQTEDIVTKLVGTYYPDYSKTKPYQVIVRRNMTKYDLNERIEDYFIYNQRDLVYKSVTFWAIHYSNTYKFINVRVFLDNLLLETNDPVSIDIGRPLFANEVVTGIIKKATYDSSNNSVALSIWLPVLSGTMEYYKFAWPKDLTVDDVFPYPEDIVSGNAGNSISVLVPTGSNFDPYDPSLLEIRPKDFGSIDVGDGRDPTPKNAATELDEIAYYNKDNQPIKITRDPQEEPTSQFVYDFFEADSRGFKKKVPVFVSFGRILSMNSTKGESIDPSTVDGGIDEIEYEPSRTYYNVELTSGKTIYARPYRISSTGKIREGDVVLVIYDEFNKDYVFQPPVTTAPRGPQ